MINLLKSIFKQEKIELVPTGYRALYKSITQSKWYIISHENKSLGEEMRIE